MQNFNAEPLTATANIVINTLSTNVSNADQTLNFHGCTVNYLQIAKENKRVGDLGELWVLKYEADKLKNANMNQYVGRVEHISKNLGDGTGFDVMSYSLDGSPMYIEVKTTTGPRGTSFFVSRNELEKSKIEKDKYYVYRLFDFDEINNIANLLIINGDLSHLCNCPVSYKVNLLNPDR